MRAQIPVRFSGGFNPRARLFLPIPRSVGIASEGELAVVELAEAMPPEEVASRLSSELPAGLRILKARSVPPEQRIRAARATYCLALQREVCESANVAAARLLASPRIEVQRGSRTIDIRPSIAALRVDRDELVISVAATPGGSARPAEVLEALGLPASEQLHRMRRVSVEWR